MFNQKQNIMEISNIQLPIFNGYYNTILSIEENEHCYINEFGEIDEDLLNKINSRETYLNISKKYVQEFNNKLEKDLVEFGISNVQFKKLYSPSFYNFSTDEIYCSLNVNTEVLYTFLKKVKNQFQAFLNENYTTTYGYIPFVSNVAETYLENLLTTDIDNRNISVILEYLVTEVLLTESNEIELRVSESYCELISYNN